MESIDPECTKLKQKYEACFYTWYSEKYLKGRSVEDDCRELFLEYRACIQKTLKAKNIDQLLEEQRRLSDPLESSDPSL